MVQAITGRDSEDERILLIKELMDPDGGRRQQLSGSIQKGSRGDKGPGPDLPDPCLKEFSQTEGKYSSHPQRKSIKVRITRIPMTLILFY